MSKFGWCYIGCGTIANTTAKEISKSENNRIVAVWNRGFAKAEAFAKKYGGTAYKTFEEAVNAPEVEGVYIALIADRHAEYIKKCIKLHKPVMCEKPFTVSAKDAEEIFALAKAEGVYVTEAMWTWHNAAAQQVKSWLEAGRIGQVKDVNIVYAFPMIQFSHSDRLTDPKRLGGAIMDIGIYGLRYCVELFGMPNKIACEGRVVGGTDRGEMVDLYYDDFTAHCHFALDKKVGESATITGTDGVISVPFFHMAKTAKIKGKFNDEIKVSEMLYDREFANVASEIRAGYTESRIITPENVVNCLKVMDECRRQMEFVFPCEMTDVDTKVSYIRTISHLGFNCKDIEKSIAFYRDIMGCKEKFTLTYGDVAADVRKKCDAEGKKYPLYLQGMKRMENTKWSVYMSWTDNTFIELFYVPSAHSKHIPNPQKSLNYTHYSIEVSDLKAFRDQILKRGGAPYIETEIERGLENTWTMWMHDPDGNRFEIMEYTPESYQVTGR